MTFPVVSGQLCATGSSSSFSTYCTVQPDTETSTCQLHIYTHHFFFNIPRCLFPSMSPSLYIYQSIHVFLDFRLWFHLLTRPYISVFLCSPTVQISPSFCINSFPLYINFYLATRPTVRVFFLLKSFIKSWPEVFCFLSRPDSRRNQRKRWK